MEGKCGGKGESPRVCESCAQSFVANQLLSLGGESFPAIAKIVDENELTELVKVGIVRPTLVRFGEFVNEIDEVWIACDHKRADDDLFPAALDGLVERLVDDARVQSERVLIQSPGFIEDCRGFTVCDHKDLLVDVAASAQQAPCKL